MVLAAVAATLWAVPGTRGVLGAALAAVMIAVAAVDARHFLIPDKLVLAASGLGFVAVGFDSAEPTYALRIIEAALRGLSLALLFLALRAVYYWWRRREGIGLGDVKLAFAAGVWLDWGGMVLAVQISALAALGVIGWRAICGHPVSAVTPIPFGLFFAPAIWLAWLIGSLAS